MRLAIRGLLTLIAPLPVAALLVSCAVVTINVNFPAREVRQAFENLEEEFLKEQQKEAGEGDEGEEGGTQGEEPEPETLEPQVSPSATAIQLRKLAFIMEVFNLDLLTPALAQEEEFTSAVTEEIRRMPEVLSAYEGRNKRLSDVRALLGAGKAGEGNQGLLMARGDLTPGESALLRDENEDRRAIITGMAKAIVKINGMPLSKSNINEVYPQAAEQFAAARRAKAKKGWYIQLPNGRWVRKL